NLIPVDPLELLVLLGELPPGGTKDIALQPACETALDGLVGRPTRGEHLPGDTRDQDKEQAMQTVLVTLGRPAVATPHDWGQERLKNFPYVIRGIVSKDACEPVDRLTLSGG